MISRSPISLILFSVFATATLFAVGIGGYIIYKTSEENARLKELLLVEPTQEENKGPSETSELVATSTNEEEEASEKPPQEEVKVVPTQKAVVTKNPSDATPATTSSATMPATLSEDVSSKEATIKIIHVGQTAYDDGMGGVYGSYGLLLSVTAVGGDVLIPLTTNETLGTGLYGFTFSVVGADPFKGKVNAEISECTLRTNGYCKFKDGQTKNIKVTVWAIPGSEDAGYFAVKFNKVTYFLNDERKTFEVNKETERINIYY